MADNTRKPTQRYLSGRVKIVNNAGLHSDRHLYVHPGEVEPNLGFYGEKTLPIADNYYQLVTINNGTAYDRYWTDLPPQTLANGISIFDEGTLVGTANSVSKINFVGSAITATASGTISTITVQVVAISSTPPSNANAGDLWWDSDFGDLSVYYEDADSGQWVSASNRVGGFSGVGIGSTTVNPESGYISNYIGTSFQDLNIVGAGISIVGYGVTAVLDFSSLSAGGANVSISTDPPTGPRTGDLWWDSDVGELYIYYADDDSNQWVETSGGSETVTISDDAPLNPNSGDLWWESDTGRLKIYYDDGDSQQWIDSNGGLLDDISTPWNRSSVGLHTLSNVGIGTTNPLAPVTSANTAVLAAGIVTAYKFYGDGTNLIGVGAGGTWAVDSIGIHTTKNVGIGTTAKSGYALYVEGDMRATGIVTFGPNSITVDGINNEIHVGTGVTIYGNTGIISATYLYGDASNLINIQGANVSISDTAPSSPTSGDLWWESDSGDLKIYYNDGGSAQWVSANSADTLVAISQTAPSSPLSGDLWWDSESGNLHVYYEDTNTAQWVTASNAIEGPQGSQGLQGTIGAQGVQGAQGVAGAQGAQGAQGFQGRQGAVGAQGNQGVQGETGVGAAGAQGSQGFQGVQGAQGAQGFQGRQGAVGAQGDAGAQGDTGAQGVQGAQGHQGVQGAAGPQGAQGAAGAQGDSGAQGAAGAQGAQGSQGHQGRQGAIGAQGAQGATGSGVAAGSNTQVQYNSSGDFAGSSNLTFDGTNLVCGGTVTSNSDEKLKTNITDIDNPLEKVLGLRGVEFDYLDSGKHSIGFIAQEVEKVVPDLVFGDDPKSVAYQNFVALLVEAVKEQNETINSLKERIDKLENR